MYNQLSRRRHASQKQKIFELCFDLVYIHQSEKWLTIQQNCWKYYWLRHHSNWIKCCLSVSPTSSIWATLPLKSALQLRLVVNQHSVDCCQNFVMFCGNERKSMKIQFQNVSPFLFCSIILNIYLNPGDGEPTLPEHDCDIDWWLWICMDDDCGRSKSESVRGLWAGALVLKCSSSLSPMMSGDESRLCSFYWNQRNCLIKLRFLVVSIEFGRIFTRSFKIGVLSPLSRLRCSSFNLSACVQCKEWEDQLKSLW